MVSVISTVSRTRGKLKDNNGEVLCTYITKTNEHAIDATGKPMIVGDTYEMYAPVAQDMGKKLGIIWDDPVNYSFVYCGVLLAGDKPAVIHGTGLHYDNSVLTEQELRGAFTLAEKCQGAFYICPAETAVFIIRPVTTSEGERIH